jgi:hypothetical protein
MEVEIPQGEGLEEALGLSDQRKLKGKLASSGFPLRNWNGQPDPKALGVTPKFLNVVLWLCID